MEYVFVFFCDALSEWDSATAMKLQKTIIKI